MRSSFSTTGRRWARTGAWLRLSERRLPQAFRAAADDLRSFLTGRVGQALIQMDLALGTDMRTAGTCSNSFYVASTGGCLTLVGTNRFQSVELTESIDDDPPKTTNRWQGYFKDGYFTDNWKFPDAQLRAIKPSQTQSNQIKP